MNHESEWFYRKMPNGRYKPALCGDLVGSFPEGDWLLKVRPNTLRTERLPLDTQKGAEILAAAMGLEQLIVDLLEKHTVKTPRIRSKKEERAWKAYAAIMGEDAILTVDIPSRYDMATAIVRELAEIVRKGVEPR